MSYKPNFSDEMDDDIVSAEIGGFVEDQIHGKQAPVPAEEPQAAEEPQPRREARTAPAAPRKRTAGKHTPTKRRPKRKREYRLFGLPQLLATVVWLGLTLVIGVTMGRVLWVCAADVLAFGRPDKEVSVTITADDDMNAIIGKLQDNGLIRYPWLFQIYADLSHAEDDIVPGTFTLNTAYDYHALVNEMSSSASKREEVTVQIPEGYTCRQIFQLA